MESRKMNRTLGVIGTGIGLAFMGLIASTNPLEFALDRKLEGEVIGEKWLRLDGLDRYSFDIKTSKGSSSFIAVHGESKTLDDEINVGDIVRVDIGKEHLGQKQYYIDAYQVTVIKR